MVIRVGYKNMLKEPSFQFLGKGNYSVVASSFLYLAVYVIKFNEFLQKDIMRSNTCVLFKEEYLKISETIWEKRSDIFVKAMHCCPQPQLFISLPEICILQG